MELVSYDGVVDQWKVDLIVARARRIGFWPDEVPDLLQRIVLEIIEFRFDPERANGAKESTVLQALIDNHLKQICRTTARYRAHIGAFELENRDQPTFAPDDRALDIQNAMANLTPREQSVCHALLDGCTKHEVAQRLQCGWHTVDRLMRQIAARFRAIGLDGYLIS